MPCRAASNFHFKLKKQQGLRQAQSINQCLLVYPWSSIALFVVTFIRWSIINEKPPGRTGRPPWQRLLPNYPAFEINQTRCGDQTGAYDIKPVLATLDRRSAVQSRQEEEEV